MTPKQIKRRLFEARAVLTAEVRRAYFAWPRFEGERLHGYGGYYLQWRQDQCRRGSVSLHQTPSDQMTMSEHAEAWAIETGQARELPARGTARALQLYNRWHDFAFADFAGG